MSPSGMSQIQSNLLFLLPTIMLATLRRRILGNPLLIPRTLGFIRRVNTKELLDRQDLKATSQSKHLEQEYNVRSNLEKLIHRYASQPYERLNLDRLISLLKDAKSSSDESHLVRAARQTLDTLRVLNAKRLVHIRSLPYMVVLNPHISLSYSLYLQSMKEILSYPPINTDDDARGLEVVLSDFLDKHADAIPRLSRGFTEIIGKYYPKDLTFQFLNVHLRERILMKITAQHYIFLLKPPNKNSMGVVDLSLNIGQIVQNQADFVNELCNLKYMKNCQVEISTNEYYSSKDTDNNRALLVNENKGINFPYIYENLEYCITEVLKNSFRAHIENDVSYDKKIEVTINKYYPHRDGDAPALDIRIRDFGGGIDPEVQGQMYDFSFTTVVADDSQYDENRSVAGMGYGLGLSKTYCELFHGTFHVETYWGYGTDVYIKLNGPNLDLIK